MPLPIIKTKIQHLPANTTGKDYVVGDVHGCLESLLLALKALSFNTATDRLISVGDLIDRGPDSKQCAELIYAPWFYAVRGNHEQLMIDALLRKDQNAMVTWVRNGGQWHYSEDQPTMISLAKDLNTLPLVITVGEGSNRYNVVHAELMHAYSNGVYIPLTDAMIDSWVFNRGEEHDMIWGRIMATGAHVSEWVRSPVHDETMSMTFVGHTPLREPVVIQRQMYIDTGAVFHHLNTNKSEHNRLSIACPTTQTLHIYSLLWRSITSIPFDEVEHTT